MKREQIERCLEQVTAYRASGLRANVWAEANGVALRSLSSWCAHAGRWRAQLEGASGCAPKVGSFVATRIPAAMAQTVRIEVCVGAMRVELHWPVTHGRELAVWLREVGR